ncbi:hypothetical protein PG985_010499 [Apiospora marii]|uniref:uncharacterized protein n=1 Tax=Apiospora marii TaxID=335849 RepID=UPI00312D4803
MASSPSPSPDPDLDPGRHTEPGDVRVILQPHVHETMGTLAAYLGFDHIANLKQCLFSPLVVMITRLLWPLVYDLSDSSYMDKIFAWFLEIGSDAQFRAHYARSADVVTTCLRDALANSNVKWEDDDDVARAIACLLVWASDVLSGAGDMSQRRASLPGADVGPLLERRQTSGGQFATLLDAVYGLAGKVTWDGRTLEEAVGVMRLVDKVGKTFHH